MCDMVSLTESVFQKDFDDIRETLKQNARITENASKLLNLLRVEWSNYALGLNSISFK